MSQDTRLASLEARVERLAMELQNTRTRTVAAEQGLWSTAGGMPSPVGGTGGLVRIWLPTGIAAGTFNTPAVKTDGIKAVASGNGWTTTGGTSGFSVYNSDTVAVSSGKAAWGQLKSNGVDYDLVVADC